MRHAGSGADRPNIAPYLLIQRRRRRETTAFALSIVIRVLRLARAPDIAQQGMLLYRRGNRLAMDSGHEAADSG
jgi:hypothetical protein